MRRLRHWRIGCIGFCGTAMHVDAIAITAATPAASTPAQFVPAAGSSFSATLASSLQGTVPGGYRGQGAAGSDDCEFRSEWWSECQCELQTVKFERKVSRQIGREVQPASGQFRVDSRRASTGDFCCAPSRAVSFFLCASRSLREADFSAAAPDLGASSANQQAPVQEITTNLGRTTVPLTVPVVEPVATPVPIVPALFSGMSNSSSELDQPGPAANLIPASAVTSRLGMTPNLDVSNVFPASPAHLGMVAPGIPPASINIRQSSSNSNLPTAVGGLTDASEVPSSFVGVSGAPFMTPADFSAPARTIRLTPTSLAAPTAVSPQASAPSPVPVPTAVQVSTTSSTQTEQSALTNALPNQPVVSPTQVQMNPVGSSPADGNVAPPISFESVQADTGSATPKLTATPVLPATSAPMATPPTPVRENTLVWAVGLASATQPEVPKSGGSKASNSTAGNSIDTDTATDKAVSGTVATAKAASTSSFTTSRATTLDPVPVFTSEAGSTVAEQTSGIAGNGFALTNNLVTNPSGPELATVSMAAPASAVLSDARVAASGPPMAAVAPPADDKKISAPAQSGASSAISPGNASPAPARDALSHEMPSAALPAGKDSSSAVAAVVPLVTAPPAPVRSENAPDLPKAHQMLDSTPPSPAAPAAAPSAVSDAQLNAQMHVGVHTDAFGAIEIRTVVQQSQVGITVHSDRDLARWFTSEVPSLESGLNSHHLNLTTVELDHGGSGVQTGTGSQQGQPRQSFSHTPGSPFAVASGTLSQEESVAESAIDSRLPSDQSAGLAGNHVSIHV